MPKKEENKELKQVEPKVKGDNDTLKVLQAQPKMPVMLPITENMEPQMVAINGCMYAIPRGVLVQVPQSVYEVIQEAQMKTLQARAKITVSQN